MEKTDGNHIRKNQAKQNGNGSWEDSPTDKLRESTYGSKQIQLAIWFVLFFAVFALVVIALTTDVVLLREGEIVFPFIQVAVPVPVTGLHVVVPPLIDFLHINLFFRLNQLARDMYKRGDAGAHVNNKVRSEDKAPKAHDVLNMLFTMLSPIDLKRLTPVLREAAPATAFLSIGFLILVTAPLLVLLVLQAHFLVYQNEGTTLFHQIMVAVNLFFQFIYTLSYIKLWGKGEKFSHKLRHLITAGLVAIPAFYAWEVAMIPDSYIENKVKSDWQQSIAGYFFSDWWKKHEGNQFSCDFLEGARFINIQSKIITLRDMPLENVGVPMKISCELVCLRNLGDRRLNYANFSGSRFRCVEMGGTQSNNSNMASVKLNGINLQTTGLSGIRLVEANLSRVHLSWASLIGADLSGAGLSRADLSGAGLSRADLSRADLSGADLSRADLSEANLIGADLWRANLGRANLSRADLRGADLSYANLSGADLIGADLSGTDLSGANLSGADLSGADLSGADLIGADLSGTDLSGANLSGADLSGADLSGANLNWAVLYSTDLSRAKVYGATLLGAQLRGAILEGAKLYGSNFSGSTLSDTSLSEVDGKKPERWLGILDNIKHVLEAAGYLGSDIYARLAEIKRRGASKLGYVPPTGTVH